MSRPSKTDLIILHATASGNPALRDGQTGESFFIRELCDQLMVPDRRSIITERFILMFHFFETKENIPLQKLNINVQTPRIRWTFVSMKNLQDYDIDNKKLINC